MTIQTFTNVSSSTPMCKLPTLPESFVLPDFDTIFNYKRGFHPDAGLVAYESAKWFVDAFPELSKGTADGSDDSNGARRRMHQFYLMQDTSRLAAYCHPNCSSDMLRVASDYLVYLFHIDDASDVMRVNETRTLGEVMMGAMPLGNSEEGEESIPSDGRESGEVNLARDFWTRFKANAGPLTQRRFCEGLRTFFEGVSIQAGYRHQGTGVIPDIESYIDLRRKTSAVITCVHLAAACNGVELSDEVVDHPMLAEMILAANDVISWSNDVFSYNLEQSHNDTHNLTSILMYTYELSLQDAVDRVYDMCREQIELYNELKSALPSFGNAKVDRDVAVYLRGVEDWIMGTYDFSFDSSRYFREQLAEVKRSRVVRLFPKDGIRTGQ